MKLAKQNVKKLGFLPKGTYDAQIIAVEEYFDYYEEELYWLFRFKIIEKDGFIYYDYCLKYSEKLNSEFSSVLMYLRYLQGIPIKVFLIAIWFWEDSLVKIFLLSGSSRD